MFRPIVLRTPCLFRTSSDSGNLALDHADGLGRWITTSETAPRHFSVVDDPADAGVGIQQQKDPNSRQSETEQSGTKSMPFNQRQPWPGVGLSRGAGGVAAGTFFGGGIAFAVAGYTVGYGGQTAHDNISDATKLEAITGALARGEVPAKPKLM
jgi:hypothetical protein